MNIFLKFGRLLEDILFPDAGRCPFCGREGGFCSRCAAAFSALTCNSKHAVFFHSGIARNAVLSLKFAGKRYLAKPMAAQMLSHLVDADVITAVPLHPIRHRARGFNQSELLARQLSKLSGIPYEELLIRTRNTLPNSTIDNHEDRFHNIKDAFAATHPGRICYQRILLVDDVITTGATAQECEKVLCAHGAASVFSLSYTTPGPP